MGSRHQTDHAAQRAPRARAADRGLPARSGGAGQVPPDRGPDSRGPAGQALAADPAQSARLRARSGNSERHRQRGDLPPAFPAHDLVDPIMSSVTSVPAVRQIFAFSGILRPEAGQKSSFDLIEHAVSLAPSNGSKRVCYLPTAVGDAQAAVDHMTAMFDDRAEIEFSVLRLFTQPSVPDVRAHLTSRDVLLVEGGSVANLMAIWRFTVWPRSCVNAGMPAWTSTARRGGTFIAGWSQSRCCRPDSPAKMASACTTWARTSTRPSPLRRASRHGGSSPPRRAGSGRGRSKPARSSSERRSEHGGEHGQ